MNIKGPTPQYGFYDVTLTHKQLMLIHNALIVYLEDSRDDDGITYFLPTEEHIIINLLDVFTEKLDEFTRNILVERGLGLRD